jgi:hypothetical protein
VEPRLGNDECRKWACASQILLVLSALTTGTGRAIGRRMAWTNGPGRLSRNPFLLRLHVDPHTLTIFPDGRAIIGGTDDVATARTLYARYVGN